MLISRTVNLQLLNRLYLSPKFIGQIVWQGLKTVGHTVFQKKVLILITVLFLLAAGTIVVAKGDFLNPKVTTPTTTIQTPQKVTIQPAKVSIPINKTFAFAIKDNSSKEIGKLKYTLTSAEKRDEILIQGQRASAITGHTFLVLNLKLINDNNQRININTRDYVRLSINGSAEWLAPDIHNDPVEVQAISTKYTRLGFSISDSDKNLKLQVGEINGLKTDIDLSLP